VLLELAHHVGDGRRLLADGDIDAENVLSLLVDDGVHRHRRLAGLAVADDEFALTATDRHHGVDGLQPGLHRLRHRLPRDDAGGDFLDLVGELGFDGAFAVDGLTEGVDDATDEFGADRHFENAAGGFHRVAFDDVFVFAEHHRADGVAFEVERETESVAGEFQHFALHRVGQSMNAADAVGDGHHRAFVARGRGKLKVLDPALDQVADFRGVELHLRVTPSS